MECESTDGLETKEFCGAAWPSKSLKGKRGTPSCPLIAPEKFSFFSATHDKFPEPDFLASQRFHLSDKRGGLNGWTQQLLEVYSRESEGFSWALV